MSVRTISTIPPPAFATTLQGLARSTGAMKNVAPHMPGQAGDGFIPGEIDPLVHLNGSPLGRSPFKHTMSLIPGSILMGKRLGAPSENPVRKFSSERDHLQGIADRITQSARLKIMPKGLSPFSEPALFISRLSAITEKSLPVLLNCKDTDVGEWVSDLSRFRGQHLFSALSQLAKRNLDEHVMDPMDNDLGDIEPKIAGEKLIEGAVLFNSLSDPSARKLVERLTGTSSELYERAGLTAAAAISSDLAARSNPGVNKHSQRAGKLLYKSAVNEKDDASFGVQYVYGLHHALRANDHDTMQGFFGASVSYYVKMNLPREAAHAIIREAWAFSQREELDVSDWTQMANDLNRAAALLEDSWSASDQPDDQSLIPTLREIAEQALELGGHSPSV